MELRHLRYFIAVAEELHFGRAAQKLHMAQQPLSRQIRHLEAEIGVELFRRTQRTVQLTEAGQHFLAEAHKTLQQADRAVAIAQQVHRGDIGQLAIGFTGPALNMLLPTLVRRMKDDHPQITLTLERLHTPEQVAALHDRRLHLGLLHPPLNDRGLMLKTIHREYLMAMLPDDHPLAKEAPHPLSIQALATESFILFPRRVGPVLYDGIISLCQQAGFSPNVVQEIAPQHSILGLVAAGLGISLLHSSAQTLGQIGVVARPLLEPTPELELAVAWHPDVINPAVPLFLETLAALS